MSDADTKRLSDQLLIFGAALAGGLVLAIVSQVALAHLSLDLTAAWRTGPGPRAAQLRGAIAWWLIAAIAFAGGYGLGTLVKYLLAQPRHLADGWGWVAGILALAILTLVGHDASAPNGLGAAASVLIGLAVFIVGAVLSPLGAFFAIRR